LFISVAVPTSLIGLTSTFCKKVKQNFGSGFGSSLKLESDPNPDQKLAKTSFFVQKFLHSLIFKHKKLSCLSSVT